MTRIIYSTGNAEKDNQLLKSKKDHLTNTTSFKEAKEKERAINKALGENKEGNALTEQPRIQGQVLAVVDDKHSAVKQQGDASSSEPASHESEYKLGTLDTTEGSAEIRKA